MEKREREKKRKNHTVNEWHRDGWHTQKCTQHEVAEHIRKKTANGHSDNSYFFMLLLLVVVVLRCSLCLPCYLDCFLLWCFSMPFFDSVFVLSLLLIHSLILFFFFCVIRLHHKSSFNTMFILCMLTPDLQPCRVLVQDYLHYTLVLYYLAFWYCTHTHRAYTYNSLLLDTPSGLLQYSHSVQHHCWSDLCSSLPPTPFRPHAQL